MPFRDPGDCLAGIAGLGRVMVDHRDGDAGLPGGGALGGEHLVGAARDQDVGGNKKDHPSRLPGPPHVLHRFSDGPAGSDATASAPDS